MSIIYIYMWKTIVDPNNGKILDINSVRGLTILNKFIQNLNGGNKNKIKEISLKTLISLKKKYKIKIPGRRKTEIAQGLLNSVGDKMNSYELTELLPLLDKKLKNKAIKLIKNRAKIECIDLCKNGKNASEKKKYCSRKSPPYSASKCHADVPKAKWQRKGNDGHWYIIKKTRNDIPRWVKKKINKKITKKVSLIRHNQDKCINLCKNGKTPSQRKKYCSRKSPPFPANKCSHKKVSFRGNDGNLYYLNKNKNGIHTWKKINN